MGSPLVDDEEVETGAGNPMSDLPPGVVPIFDAPENADQGGSPPQDLEPQRPAEDSGAAYATPAASEDGEGGQDSQPTDGAYDPGAAPYTYTGQAPEDGGGAPAGPLKAPTLPQTPDFGDSAQNFRDLEARYAKFAETNYKPSIWRRLGAGLAGGATTFGGGDGTKMSEAVLNAPLVRGQRQLQADVAPIQQRINDTGAQNQQRQQQYGNQVSQYNMQERDLRNQGYAADQNAQARLRDQNAYEKSLKLVPVDPNNKFGEWQQVDPKGKVVARDQEPPATIKNDSRYQLYKTEQTISAAAEAGHPFTTEQQQILRGGGKITYHPAPNPRQAPTGEVELNAARDAFIRQYGRPPQTLEEQNQVTQAARGTLTPRNDPSQVIIDKAQKYAHGLQRIPEGNRFPPPGSYVPASVDPNRIAEGILPKGVKVIPGKEYEDTLQGFRDEVKQHGADVDENWNLVRGSAGPVADRTAPTAAPAQQAQPQSAGGAGAPARPALPTQRIDLPAAPKTFDKALIPKNIPLPAGNVWVQAPNNGPVGHIPQTNLQKAIARGYAVPGGQ